MIKINLEPFFEHIEHKKQSSTILDESVVLDEQNILHVEHKKQITIHHCLFLHLSPIHLSSETSQEMQMPCMFIPQYLFLLLSPIYQANQAL